MGSRVVRRVFLIARRGGAWVRSLRKRCDLCGTETFAQVRWDREAEAMDDVDICLRCAWWRTAPR